MQQDKVIDVKKLSKRYGLPLSKSLSYVRNLFHLFQRRTSGVSQSKEFALQDISFSVGRGEFLGLIGRNGAGKSTLLKVLAGVTPPTTGQVEMHGRIFPMIELNAGLHRELTGRENVSLLGIIMGFSRSEVEAKMDDIEAFTELGNWFDQPIRKYSSGMLARLGFGVAMNVQADILLIDEVLAVGDLSFQRKCFDRIEELRRGDSAILFVSHNVRQVERLCDRVLLFEGGKIEMEGDPTDVLNQYYYKSHQMVLARTKMDAGKKTTSSLCTGDISIYDIIIVDDDGRQTDQVHSGDSIRLRVRFQTAKRIERPFIGLGFLSTDLVIIASFSNDDMKDRPDFDGNGWFDCMVSDIPLVQGVYYIKMKIMNKNGAVIFGNNENLASFQVLPEKGQQSNLSQQGLVKIEAKWDAPVYSDCN
ncbi:ABC transporter ATP-binding protein [Desulfobacterales bacterium HSG16]|nr:ABC transporter ATP-binding protein [Desulfobacterales bacterium HSG16]